MNHHYYTVFIPEDYKKISLEIHGYGINIYAINGKEKINRIHNGVYDLKYYNRPEIITLKKAELNLTSFKNQYISFSVFKNDTKLNKIINYYFRVLHTDSINNIIIYPLDSNVENLCYSELILNHNSCYFLLKNDYNELSHNIIISELYDNAKNYTYAIISKKEDYYSINLNNKNFNEFYVNLDLEQNITEDSYVIIRIDVIFTTNWYLTISSGFTDTESSILIYSYKLIYINEKNKKIFDLDEKTKQFKLRLINNVPENNKLEISFYKNNNAKSNINNNYGKQFSCLIEEFIKLEFSCKNESFIFLKFDYKRKRQNLVELNYHDYLIPILTFPIIFYIKDFYNNGIDFNIYPGSKIGNLDIYGYVVDFLDLEKLDEKKNKESVEYHHLINGIYDNVTQTGVIEFNKFDYSKFDFKDIYYVIEIIGDSSKISPDSNILINSNPKNNSKFRISLGKYIRGIFNSSQDKQQTYYTELNKDKNNTLTIIELSSNYKNVELSTENIIFKKVSKEYAQIYITESKIDNFTIKIEDNDNITINNSHLIVNYIFKYNYSNYSIFNDENYSPKFECLPNPKKISQNKENIKIECNNNEENKNNLIYSYSLRLYDNINQIKDEELTTLAITSHKYLYFNECQTSNSSFSFYVNNIYAKKDYHGILFINYEYNNEKIYKVKKFIINVGIESYSNNKNLIIIVSIISFIIIVFIILTIILVKMKKKNKELEEKVNNVSFGDKDNDTEISDDELNSKVSYI